MGNLSSPRPILERKIMNFKTSIGCVLIGLLCSSANAGSLGFTKIKGAFNTLSKGDINANFNSLTNSPSVTSNNTFSGANTFSDTLTGSGLITAPSMGTGVVNYENVTVIHTVNSNSTITVVTTGGAVNITLPEASTVLGVDYTILFLTDGGTDLTVNTATGDTLNPTGNTRSVMNDVADILIVRAVSASRWLIRLNTGGVLSTP